MRLKRITETILIISLIFITVIVLSKIRRKSGNINDEKDIAVGKGLLYKVFDSSNKVSLEIRCDRSIKAQEEKSRSRFNDRFNLFGIRGVIYKKGRITSDTSFSSRQGYVENNFMNLFLDGNAKIESEDILIESDNLLLEGNARISTNRKVEYWLKDLDGVAKNGLEYFTKKEVLKLFDTSGTFVKNNRKYRFVTQKLVVTGKDNKLIFKGGSVIENDYSRIKGRMITMNFTEDFKNIKNANIFGKSYVFLKGDNPGDFKEAYGKRIVATFHDNGTINEVDIQKNGIVNIKNPEEKLKVESDMMFIGFNPLNERIRFVRALKGSRVSVSGKNSFDINAMRLKIDYDEEGEVSSAQGFKNCKFDFEGYKGTSRKIKYEPKKGIANISGKRSIIEKSGGRFISSDFTIDLKNEKLFSDKKITSTVLLKESNPVFTVEAVFVSSKNIEIFEEKKLIKYSADVKLIQGSTEIKCDTLEIEDKNRINISGNSVIKLENSGKTFVIRGKSIDISDSSNKISVRKDAGLKFEESSVSGKSIDIIFNSANKIVKIKGEGDINFERENLKGSSGKIDWDIGKKEIIFYDNAVISRENSGKTKGEIIKYYPELEKIRITSKRRKRSKTSVK